MNMEKEIKRFGNLCIKTQEELKVYLHRFLMSNGYKVVNEDGFLYAKGTLPYLVTAHMDTVHLKQCNRYSVHNYSGKHRIQSPVGIGGDDRCGIYMIVRMILDGYRPTVLFCEDEEIGSVGATKFTYTEYVDDLKELNYFIELDRANANDAVFYDCDNPKFTEFILDNSGYKKATGSFTDIVELSDATGIASVNFSCGYYNPHREKEYVIFEEMMDTIKMVEGLLDIKDCEQFEFIRVKRQFYPYEDYFWCKNYFGNEYDCYEKYSNYNSYNSMYDDEEVTVYLEVTFNDNIKCKENTAGFYGKSEEECFYNFFLSYPYACLNDVIDYNVY